MNDKLPKHAKANRFLFDDTPTFDQAKVPGYMQQLEIDTLPANQAFFIEPAAEQSWKSDMPAIIVNKKTNGLYLDGTTEVDADQHKPTSPLGQVGIMRVEAIGPDGKTVSFFVADLRFIENHELSVVDDLDDAPDDSEDFNSWVEYKNELREVVAFIAPIPGTEASKKGIVPASYYGPEKYYGALDDLRQQGDKILTKSVRRQRQSLKLAKAAANEESDTETVQPEEKKPEKAEPKKPSLAVVFSSGQ